MRPNASVTFFNQGRDTCPIRVAPHACKHPAFIDALPAHLRTPADATALLQETVHQVRTGQLAPAVANSIGYLVSVALKSFELDVIRRLDEIEKARAAHAIPIRIVSEAQR
jgi:hypothetical protein